MPTWTPAGFAAHLGRYSKERRRQMKDAAYVVANRGIFEGAEVANKLGIVDRGTYKARFKTRRTRMGAELRNDAPHAAVIEYGRSPGSTPPPAAALYGWIRRKMGLRGGAAHQSKIHGIAIAIARAIGQRGLPAHAVFRRHINPKLKVWFREEIRVILASDPPTTSAWNQTE